LGILGYFCAAEKVFAMTRNRFKIVAITAMCVLLLSGCKSSKGAVSGSGKWQQSSSVSQSAAKPDYSDETTVVQGSALVAEARKWIGTPYRYGGCDRDGTDCSGFVMSVYKNVCGIKLPRSSSEQRSYCMEVSRNKTSVGDLVFFGSTSKVSHVGLYIGNGEMIHASTSRGVMVSSIDNGYWLDHYCGAGHVAAAGKVSAKKGKSKEQTGEQQSKNELRDKQAAQDKQSKTDKKNKKDKKSKKKKGNAEPWQKGEKQTKPEKQENVAPQRGNTEIELLDLIINQKVDSIFSSKFMD
jgi:hypothetical protein